MNKLKSYTRNNLQILREIDIKMGVQGRKNESNVVSYQSGYNFLKLKELIALNFLDLVSFAFF